MPNYWCRLIARGISSARRPEFHKCHVRENDTAAKWMELQPYTFSRSIIHNIHTGPFEFDIFNQIGYSRNSVTRQNRTIDLVADLKIIPAFFPRDEHLRTIWFLEWPIKSAILLFTTQMGKISILIYVQRVP